MEWTQETASQVAELTRLGYRFGQFRVFAMVENILDSEWSEAQFDTESRLKYETEPVSEINFTPGNPLNLQAGISWEF